ncbi:MAG: ABC transporter ATP-binding protein [Hominenteromicrobium sp.]
MKRRNQKDKSVLRAFFACYKPYLKTLLPLLLLALLATGAALLLPLCIRYITDGGAQTAESLRNTGLFMLALLAVQVTLKSIVDYRGHVMGARMERDIRQKLYNHLLAMPVSFFDSHRVGALLSNLTNDLNELVELFHHMPEDIVLYFVRLVGAAVILFSINARLTLAVFALLPPMLVFTVFFSMRMRRACARSYEKIGEINAQAEDTLSGIRVLKAFAAEDAAAGRFAEANEAFFKSRKTIYGSESLVYQGSQLFIDLAPVVVAVFGGWAIAGGSMTLGEILPFLLYVGYITTPIQHLIHMIGQFQNGYAGFTRYWALMQTKSDMEDGAVEAQNLRGEVEFKDICFSYETTGTVLEHVSLRAEPGEFVAVVGRSGAGKTTLCALISRLYDVDSGAVCIDGRDVRDYTLRSLRAQIGVVEQATYLFAGTVAENIAFGTPGAEREQVIDAAKRANAHEFIMALPNGYDTYVGERGVRLSGGQRQRISIARVFLKNPPILVFDEATSALDAESELAVRRALDTLAQSRTTFVIAHRLSTVRHADRTIVISEKGIAQTGTHESLMETDGVYRSLYGLQTEE